MHQTREMEIEQGVLLEKDRKRTSKQQTKHHWIGLRENLQETMVSTIKYRGFRLKFPLNQSNENMEIQPQIEAAKHG